MGLTAPCLPWRGSNLGGLSNHAYRTLVHPWTVDYDILTQNGSKFVETYRGRKDPHEDYD